MVENAARCFEVHFAINESVVIAVGYIYAKMANLVIKLATVDMADDAYKNSNFHLRSPFRAIQRLIKCQRIVSSILTGIIDENNQN